jgi:acyl carrier protein
MNLWEFTSAIQKLFDSNVFLTPDTNFRDNDDFDSLIGMSMLVLIKDNFGYAMSVNEFLGCNTPADLYMAIKKQHG